VCLVSAGPWGEGGGGEVERHAKSSGTEAVGALHMQGCGEGEGHPKSSGAEAMCPLSQQAYGGTGEKEDKGIQKQWRWSGGCFASAGLGGEGKKKGIQKAVVLKQWVLCMSRAGGGGEGGAQHGQRAVQPEGPLQGARCPAGGAACQGGPLPPPLRGTALPLDTPACLPMCPLLALL
jgi:hypothetical protein